MRTTHNKARSEFQDRVSKLAEEMVFPVNRKNALSLIQLTLYVLEREYNEKEKNKILYSYRRTNHKFDTYLNKKYL